MIKGDNPAERLYRVLDLLLKQGDGPALDGWQNVLTKLCGDASTPWETLRRFGMIAELVPEVQSAINSLPENESVELWTRHLPQVATAFENFLTIGAMTLNQFRIPLTAEVLYSIEGAAAVLRRYVGTESVASERLKHYRDELFSLLADVVRDREALGKEASEFLEGAILGLVTALEDHPFRGPVVVQRGTDAFLGSVVRQQTLIRETPEHPFFKRLGVIAAGILLALDLGTHTLELLPANIQAALGHRDHQVTEIHNLNETVTVIAANEEPSSGHPPS